MDRAESVAKREPPLSLDVRCLACEPFIKLSWQGVSLIRITLIEDNASLAKGISYRLQDTGHAVDVLGDGAMAEAYLVDDDADLVILDINLPGTDGLTLLAQMRARGDMRPVILLTAPAETQDRVTGLDAGADDYVVKPFSVEELLARVRARIRRTSEESSEDNLEFEDLKLNRSTREVYRNGRLIELTAKEFDLLEYLLGHPRQVITRDRILEEVWGYDFMGDSNIIEVYVRYLRLKLEANKEKRLIQTVRGVGYVLRE